VRYSLTLNQVKMVEWDLSVKAGLLMCVMTTLSSWATPVVQGSEVYYILYRDKIIVDIPLIGKSRTTISKFLKELKEKDLIEVVNENFTPAYRLTSKGREWLSDRKNSNSGEISPVKKTKKELSLSSEMALEDVGEEYQKLLHLKCYEYCKENNIRYEEMLAFASWHIAKGTLYKNWYRAFIVWCSRDRKSKIRKTNVGTRGDLTGKGDNF